ncbi:hypothetical protein CW703_01865 [Candidatus Bathyarchaeota archaeon]|nr:MAG: hypothetical protein CW703_01865 [Candidatus Bathyarchaeota archaeon]
MIHECYVKAVEVLKKNSTNLGFKASFNFYDSIWSRDGSISCCGATLTKDEELLKTARKTLEVFKRNQTMLGQIPNAVNLDGKPVSWYALDANLWWIIGVWNYYKATHNKNFLKNFWPSTVKAVRWLEHHVIDKSCLISSCESADWMDSSIGRRGKVFYINCLWFKAVKCINELAEELGEEKLYNPEKIKRMVNILFWPTHESCEEILRMGFVWRNEFYEEAVHEYREHYLHFVSFEWYEGRCDTFANVLAILWNIADKNKTKRIIEYFFKKKISKPYPVKVLNPPIWIPSYTWNPKMDIYRLIQHQNRPFYYHNSGIWPYVGGFYVLMLKMIGEKKKAEKELERLAEANKIGKEKEWEFNEWLHGKTGKPMGAIFQSWSAAGYILAYKTITENLQCPI